MVDEDKSTDTDTDTDTVTILERSFTRPVLPVKHHVAGGGRSGPALPRLPGERVT